MKTKDEALKMAIEYIDKLKSTGQTNWLEINVIQNACKEALEQPAQEPVDVARVQEDGYVEWNPDLPDLPVGTKLYTHPHQDGTSPSGARDKEFVKLTDDEIAFVVNDTESLFHLEDFARAIEQALKEKNT